MKTMDISTYTISELEVLQSELEQELKRRQQEETVAAREQIHAIAQAAGISLSELSGSTVKIAATKQKNASPRFRNPADTSQTWSGRGRRPSWIVSALSKGGALEDFGM